MLGGTTIPAKSNMTSPELMIEIMRGGKAGAKRLEEFLILKDELEDLYERLAIGVNATQALEDAQAFIRDAKVDRELAVSELDTAKKESKALVAEAKKEAGEIKAASLRAAKDLATETQRHYIEAEEAVRAAEATNESKRLMTEKNLQAANDAIADAEEERDVLLNVIEDLKRRIGVYQELQTSLDDLLRKF